jgi:NAD(P)-dependent dehydrogenase (short-subunit alcohol dehydrogenase family)
MNNDLSTKTFVVTGATSGIGLAVAEALAARGAALIGVGRSAERCRQAESHLRQIAPDARVRYLLADLSLQSEVLRLAAEIRQWMQADGRGGLDGLVNNAAAFTYWMTLTPEGIETQWAVNHLAAFLLTRQLLPLLLAAPSARVVTVSSDSHYGARLDWDDLQQRRRYNALRAYGNTKLANILFTQHLNAVLGSGGAVRAFAADPGLVKTDIGMKATPRVARWVWKLRRSGGVSPQQAAAGVVYLLTELEIQVSSEVYWKDGRPKRPSRQALDVEAARRLWHISEQMCAQPEGV